MGYPVTKRSRPGPDLYMGYHLPRRPSRACCRVRRMLIIKLVCGKLLYRCHLWWMQNMCYMYILFRHFCNAKVHQILASHAGACEQIGVTVAVLLHRAVVVDAVVPSRCSAMLVLLAAVAVLLHDAVAVVVEGGGGAPMLVRLVLAVAGLLDRAVHVRLLLAVAVRLLAVAMLLDLAVLVESGVPLEIAFMLVRRMLAAVAALLDLAVLVVTTVRLLLAVAMLLRRAVMVGLSPIMLVSLLLTVAMLLRGACAVVAGSVVASMLVRRRLLPTVAAVLLHGAFVVVSAVPSGAARMLVRRHLLLAVASDVAPVRLLPVAVLLHFGVLAAQLREGGRLVPRLLLVEAHVADLRHDGGHRVGVVGVVAYHGLALAVAAAEAQSTLDDGHGCLLSCSDYYG
ncbi:unnamed protein product [Triticum turgidum subsp. durum]|uniref:Uncharacterized protein n=1 Tax=Triticum turgidum subsp. durum TaxID=4567 RepID=A0A9R0RWL8_TRITD|nr:unnamed protein product [Triticum turgidum subsp. durum]